MSKSQFVWVCQKHRLDTADCWEHVNMGHERQIHWETLRFKLENKFRLYNKKGFGNSELIAYKENNGKDKLLTKDIIPRASRIIIHRIPCRYHKQEIPHCYRVAQAIDTFLMPPPLPVRTSAFKD